MVKGSIGDRILECIGYPESWTEQEIEDNKRIVPTKQLIINELYRRNFRKSTVMW